MQAKRARNGTIVEVIPAGRAASGPPKGNDDLDAQQLRLVGIDTTTGQQTFTDRDGNTPGLANADRLLRSWRSR